MEPSHLTIYSNAEIERIAATTLQEAFPKSLSIPVDIDLVAEKQPVFDSIRFVPGLQEKYNTVSTLQSKPTKKCDIVLDENMSSTYNARTNFSVAHELAHIILHEKLYLGCYTIEDSIALSKRIKNSYRIIERNANYFAGAIIVPRKTVFDDAERLYEGILKGYAGDLDWNGVMPMLRSALANFYQVSIDVMAIRLKQLRIDRCISRAVANKFDFISWD